MVKNITDAQKADMVGCIMEAFTCREAIAEVVMAIIDQEFDKIEKVIAEATEEAQEQIDEDNEMENGGDLHRLTLEHIAAYLVDFDLSEGRGNNGHMYELENGQTFMLGYSSRVEEEAEAQAVELFNEQIECNMATLAEPHYTEHRDSAADWIRDNVIKPFIKGISLEEAAKEGATVDILASYDGDTHTTGDYTWFRTN